jgi:hypothetical protein
VIELSIMKPAEFIASALDDISAMPDEVKRVFGFAIRSAQRGEKHPDAKPLKGFGGAVFWKWLKTMTVIHTERFIRSGLQASCTCSMFSRRNQNEEARRQNMISSASSRD